MNDPDVTTGSSSEAVARADTGSSSEAVARADTGSSSEAVARADDVVRIFDTTLRDGEQAPGIALTRAEKVEIAEQLARLDVDILEAGFPISSQGEFEAVREIADDVKGPVIAALARTATGDIERAAEALKGAERWRIHTFISTSDVQRESMLKMSHRQVLDAIRENVSLAKSYTPDVEFSAQDATRTELGFLLETYRLAVECGATTINVPDTVGYATPTEFGELIRVVREAVPDEVVISTHCHNDLGLAVANALAGIENGARQIEVAVNGIGERAGNCSLEEIAMIVRTRGEYLGVRHGLNLREITRTSRLVSMTTGYGVQPNKAVVGSSAFAHESGIHQHGVLANRATYEIMDPLEIGLEGNRLVLGKHSGRHAFVDALDKLGITLDEAPMNRAFARFKDLADRKISLTDQDLAAIVAEELGSAEEDLLVLESVVVGGGTHLQPRATVHLKKGDETIEESAIGDGLIDAAMGAIARASGIEARLVSFNVSSVTGGSDALGDVVVQLDVDGRRVTGRGVATDVVEASARAYLAAINRALQVQAKDVAQSNEVTP
jgi:2-isopropylmalate synthase